MSTVGNNLLALSTLGILTYKDAPFEPDLDEVLEASPAAILASYLEDLDLVSNPDESGEWPVYINYLPYDVDEVLAIYDTTGIYDGRLMSTNEEVNHYGIQIRIRSKEYTTGYLKLKQIVTALNQVVRQTVTRESIDYYIQNFTQTSAIVRIGVEDEPKRRVESTVNFLMVTYKVSS